MKVYIESTTWWQDDEIIDRYPALEEFGYSVEKIEYYDGPLFEEDDVEKRYIHINSLEDLVKLRRAVNKPLIFYVDDDGEYILEIYDGYRE